MHSATPCASFMYLLQLRIINLRSPPVGRGPMLQFLYGIKAAALRDAPCRFELARQRPGYVSLLHRASCSGDGSVCVRAAGISTRAEQPDRGAANAWNIDESWTYWPNAEQAANCPLGVYRSRNPSSCLKTQTREGVSGASNIEATPALAALLKESRPLHARLARLDAVQWMLERPAGGSMNGRRATDRRGSLLSWPDPAP
jgi:hypothetical protein